MRAVIFPASLSVMFQRLVAGSPRSVSAASSPLRTIDAAKLLSRPAKTIVSPPSPALTVSDAVGLRNVMLSNAAVPLSSIRYLRLRRSVG